MIDEDELALAFAAAVDEAVDDVLLAQEAGLVVSENDFSSQLLAEIRHRIFEMDGHRATAWSVESVGGDWAIDLKGRRLTDQGPGSEEKKIGADMVFVLQVRLPTINFTKGLLIQAKKVNAHGRIRSKKEQVELLSQCRKMTSLSNASFVFGYSPVSVFTHSAMAITSGRNLSDSTLDPFTLFYDLFKCVKGDPNISAVDRASLEKLYEQYRPRVAALVSITAPDEID